MNLNAIIYAVIFLSCVRVFASKYENLSSFEKHSVDKALKKYKLSPDNDPKNKVINNIIIFVDSPFEEKDCFSLFNYLHVNSKESIINHSIIIYKNEAYNEARILENEIILKNGVIRSVAVIIPVQIKDNESDKELSLLVVTKDLFSLIPEGYISGYNLNIDEFKFSLSEHNLLGTNQSISIYYSLEDKLYTGAISYMNPKLFNSPFKFNLSPKLFFSESHDLQGFSNYISLKRPVISVNDLWSYGFDSTISKNKKIETKGTNVRKIIILDKDIERRYNYTYFDAKIFLNRYFGTKSRFGLYSSYNINLNHTSIPSDLYLNAEQKKLFTRYVLPNNKNESFFTFGLGYYNNEYMTLYNYETFSLHEYKRLGASISISNDFSAKIILSDSNFIRPKLNFNYTLPLGTDAFVGASFSTSNKYDGEFTMNEYSFLFDIVSPSTFDMFRLIAQAKTSFIFNNRDNTNFTLGAKNGLRGIVPNYFLGSKLMKANVELRSLPLDLNFAYAGLVFFYDLGTAFSAWDLKEFSHSIGVGLRILIPQFNTDTIRLDVASPLNDPKNVLFSFGLAQAF